MKIVFLADTHLGFDYPIHPRVERRRRGSDFFVNYQAVLDHALSSGVDMLVHGGDMFFRSKVPRKIIELAYAPLLKVLDSGIKILLLPGNHERSRLPDTPLFNHPGLTLFDKPKSIDFNSDNLVVRIGGFPNISDGVQGQFSAAINQCGILEGHAQKRILLLHQSIENAVVGVQNFRFERGPDVISLDQFPENLDLILSGHIHRHQELRSRKGTPIIYPGSIDRTSFAERNEVKGFYELFVNAHDIRRRFRTLPTRPMQEISLPPHLDSRETIIAYLQSQLNSVERDSILRLKPGNEAQIKILTAGLLRQIFPSSMNVNLAFSRMHPVV